MGIEHSESSAPRPVQSDQPLRERAEEIAASQPADSLADINDEAVAQIFHELRVHQIELEMQNDELRRTYQTLQASQERYFDLYDLAPVGFMTLDQQNTILDVNLTAAQLLGTNKGALLRRKLTQFIRFEDQDAYYRCRRHLLTDGITRQCELCLKRVDGALCWVEMTMVLRDEKPLGILVYQVSVSDISARKQAESDRRASDAIFASLFDLSPIAMSIDTLTDGVLRDVNSAFVRDLGYTRTELLDRTFNARQLYDDPTMRVALVQELQRTGRVTGRPAILRTQSSEARTCLISMAMITLADKECVLSGIVDITERARVEKGLEESQKNLARAQQIGHLGSWEWDVQLHTLFWSDELYRIFGVGRDFPLTYAGIEAMLHPDDRASNNAGVQAALAGAESTDFAFRIVRPNGEVRHIRQSIESTRDATGAVSKLFGIMQDVTERKLVEEEHERLQSELAQAQKMETVGRLAGGIAHDFNNMLAVITMRAEMSLGLVSPTSPLHHQLESIYQVSQRSAKLVHQLLGFARKQPIEPRVLDVNATVEKTLELLRQMIGEEIELRFQPAADLWQVKMDPSQIDQILANLCVNARDAINGAGWIAILTANVQIGNIGRVEQLQLPPGDYVVLTVGDNGSGMDKATLAQIFEPFFTTKEVGKGTGLGLATVHGIVHQNGGDIQVYSRQGSGTTFSIYLPRHATDTDMPSYAAGSSLAIGHGETLLLVEDEVEVLRIEVEALQQLGYVVLSAASPEEALRIAMTCVRHIDLLVTDVIMPGMNGRQLMQRVAQLQPDVNVLYMSGYPADLVAHRGVLEDGVAFLQKPFSLSSLALKVREAIN